MVLRVTGPGHAAFELRKGEEGLSIFDPDAVSSPLTESEILEVFPPGSQIVARTLAEIEARGLTVIPVPGAGMLPQRLRDAHAEIRPVPGMSRSLFKQALKGLE